MNPTEDIEFDENSDPSNPRKIKYDDILAASRKIVGAVMKTPCPKAHLSDRLGVDMYYKQEFLHYTGSFKERGVRNVLLNLNDEQKKHGVMTASSGNHGYALSYHTKQLAIPCVIVMPTFTLIGKINKCEVLGARVIVHGATIEEAKRHAMIVGKEKKMSYIDGIDHPHMIEGNGTIGIEIIEQIPAVDAILIPVGGGGLLAGVAIAVKHLKPDTEIYGIETEKTCSMVESLRKKERVYLPIDSSIADSLAVNMVGVNAFHNVGGSVVDRMIVVKEDFVAHIFMNIVEEEKLLVEPAGCVGVAAILAGLFPNLKGKKVVCILTGGNIEPTILIRALERGLAEEGRMIKFTVTIEDRPGGMAELCSLLGNIGIAVRDCLPERSWVKGNVHNVELTIIAETRGWDQTKEMIEQVKKRYKVCNFPDTKEAKERAASARRGPCLAPNPICMQK